MTSNQIGNMAYSKMWQKHTVQTWSIKWKQITSLSKLLPKQNLVCATRAWCLRREAQVGSDAKISWLAEISLFQGTEAFGKQYQYWGPSSSATSKFYPVRFGTFRPVLCFQKITIPRGELLKRKWCKRSPRRKHILDKTRDESLLWDTPFHEMPCATPSKIQNDFRRNHSRIV